MKTSTKIIATTIFTCVTEICAGIAVGRLVCDKTDSKVYSIAAGLATNIIIDKLGAAIIHKMGENLNENEG